MNKSASMYRALTFTALFLLARAAFAHAMPEQTIPSTGAVLNRAPAMATIRFDSDLEPIFSTLIVKNGADKQVSKGKGEVAPSNPKLLATELNKLPPGLYHVYWNAVSRDGHKTEGDYTFTVK